jgi:hypothetical protein
LITLREPPAARVFGHKEDHLMIKETSKVSLWKALYVL